MGLFKILKGAAMGVGAVVALPIAGPVGAVTLAGGAIAAATGAGVAKMLDEMDEEEKRIQEEEITKLTLKAQKADKIINETKDHMNYIIALSALGIAMANSDGEITEEELEELDEFIGGLASAKYPSHIIEKIESFVQNPPTFNEALSLLELLSNNIDYKAVRDVLVVIMEADGIIHKKEKAFLEAFDTKIHQIIYTKEEEENFIINDNLSLSNEDDYALFYIDEVFLVKNKVVSTGVVMSGEFKVGDIVRLTNDFGSESEISKATILTIEMYQNEKMIKINKATENKKVGISLSDVTKEEVQSYCYFETGII